MTPWQPIIPQHVLQTKLSLQSKKLVQTKFPAQSWGLLVGRCLQIELFIALSAAQSRRKVMHVKGTTGYDISPRLFSTSRICSFLRLVAKCTSASLGNLYVWHSSWRRKLKYTLKQLQYTRRGKSQHVRYFWSYPFRAFS
jgi:hypothetical protein